MIPLPSCGDSDNEIHEDKAEVGKVGISDGEILEQNLDNDAEIEEGQFISKMEIAQVLTETIDTAENAVVSVKTVAEIERNNTEMSSENGFTIEHEASEGCLQDIGCILLFYGISHILDCFSFVAFCNLLADFGLGIHVFLEESRIVNTIVQWFLWIMLLLVDFLC